MSRQNLVEYYAKRAREYDRIYERPERQEDLALLSEHVLGWTRGRRVLELACGTGWWTERIARVAAHVVATDAAPEVLEVARARTYPDGRVEIRHADAFDLHAIAGDFDTVLAGFWLSHLNRADVPGFLDAVHDRVGFGGRVVLFDNRFVEGSSTPLAPRDRAGDTYQTRRLEDGREFCVLKNFFDSAEIRHWLRGRASELRQAELRYYWAAQYAVER